MSTAAAALKAPSNAYGHIVEKFVDNASFLWVLRSNAVDQPNYFPGDIKQLDQRIDAQLHGLLAAGESSWQACLASLEYQEAGEVFVAAVVAFHSRDPVKIRQVVEAGFSSEETQAGLISALGWLEAGIINGWIREFLNSKDFNHKYLATAGCSIRRVNPGDVLGQILQRDDCCEHSHLYARALRLVGELKCRDMAPQLQVAMQSENIELRFWSYWSACLLGSHSSVSQLREFVMEAGPLQSRAIELCFRLLPLEEARSWISELGAIDGQIRAVIKATAVLGDPHAIDWLITKMDQPEISRLAGEAFCQISGIDIEQFGLTVEQPTTAYEDEDDEASERLPIEDENLPWPDVDKIKTIWSNHRANFAAGRRYFMGKPISGEILRSSLARANQRQRKSAAIEISLIEPTMILPNIKAKL